MSTQLIVGVAGALILGPAGFALTSGLTGFAIGAAVGGLLTNKKSSFSTPAQDLRAPKVEYGSPIPRFYGRERYSPTIAWQGEAVPVVTEQDAGGKGGGGQTVSTTTYYRDVILLIGDGTNVIGTPRGWFNKTLVRSTLVGVDDATLAANDAGTYFAEWRFYDGSPSQLPDPDYEAAVGTANAIAWRGRSTVFIKGVNCGTTTNLPYIEVEVVTKADFSTGGLMSVVGTLEGLDTHPLLPAGTRSGDAIVLTLAARGTVGGPATFTAIGEQGVSGGGSHLCVFGRIADGTADDADMDFTSGGDGTQWNCTVYRGIMSEIFPASVPITFANEGGSANPGQVGSASFIGDTQLVHTAVLTENPTRTPITGVPSGYTQAGAGLSSTDSFGGGAGFKHQLWVAYRSGITGGTENPPPFVDDGTIGSVSLATVAIMLGIGGAGDLFDPRPEDLADIVEAECLRAGVAADDLDVEELRGYEVDGIVFDASARDGLETLRAAYYFDAVADFKLHFRMRGSNPVATVPWAHSGANENEAGDAFYGPKRDNDSEIARKVVAAYTNLKADYDAGSEEADRLVPYSTKIDQLQLKYYVATPPRAKAIALTAAADGRLASQSAVVALGDEYIAVQPCDVLVTTDPDGTTYRMRSTEQVYGGGVSKHTLVLDDPRALTRIGITSDNTQPVINILGPAEVEFLPLDVPLLDASLDSPGHLVVAMGSGKYTGASITRSITGDVFTQVATILEQGIIGTTTDVLGDFDGGNTFDTENGFTFTHGNETVNGSTRDLVLDELANRFLVGDHGRWELVAAVDVELQSVLPNTSRATQLLRGLAGTEWAMGLHEVGDKVVPLFITGRGMRNVADTIADMNATRFLKAVPFGVSASGIEAVEFINTEVRLKPLAPIDLRINRDTPGVIEVTWDRRSRLQGDSMSGSIPLGEATEAYAVDLLLGTDDDVVQTTTVTEPRWSSSTALSSLILADGVWGLRKIGGQYFGVSLEGPTNGNKYLLKQDSTSGALLVQSAYIGQEVYAQIAVGTDIYVAVAEFTPTPPYGYTSGRVRRYASSDLTAPAAQYDGTLDGDPWGLAHDGSDLWVAERFSEQLVPLDPSTLAAGTPEAMTGGPTALWHDSGDLYICCADSDEVVRWDIGTTTETWRVSVARPNDILVASGLVYVTTQTALMVLDASDGSVIAAYPTTSGVTITQGRTLAVFGSQVISFIRTPSTVVLLLDAATGAEDARLNVDATTLALAGVDGAYFFLATSPAFTSTVIDTRRFELSGDLAGYRVRVQQISATVGRGYPAEIEL